MEKDTSKIVEELGLCPDFKTFYHENKDYMLTGTLADLLNRLIAEKGLKKAQVIKSSELSEVYGYQIFSGIRVPERKKLLCLAVGMGLNIEEAQQLLKCAGYPQLYVSCPLTVLYCTDCARGCPWCRSTSCSMNTDWRRWDERMSVLQGTNRGN